MLVIEYGSRLRGDYDYSSDRDVLILSDSRESLISEERAQKERGNSVSYFTMSSAHYLVSTGSLFFKHIKDEGVLVSGSPEEYTCLMKEWSPAASYTREIEQNLDVMDLLAYTPQSDIGCTSIVDLIICSVRNVLIKRLAESGVYVFSWGGIFKASLEQGKITPADFSLLVTARKIKNLYRKGKRIVLEPSFFNELTQTASRVLGIKNYFSFSSRKTIAMLPECYTDGSYKQLRAIELMCSEFDGDPALFDCRYWVKNPSHFLRKRTLSVSTCCSRECSEYYPY